MILTNITNSLTNPSSTLSSEDVATFKRRFAKISVDFAEKFCRIQNQLQSTTTQPVSLDAILRCGFRLSLTNYASSEWNESQPMVGFYPPGPLQADIMSGFSGATTMPSTRIGVAKSVMMNIENRIKKSVMERKPVSTDFVKKATDLAAVVKSEKKDDNEDGQRKRPRRVINFGFDDDDD